MYHFKAFELRDTVNLVTKSLDAMVRDFVALRTSCVHQWHTLQSELQQKTSQGSSDGASSTQGSPQRQHHIEDVTSGSIPNASLSTLLQQIETMLVSFINQEKSIVMKLTRQVEDEKARRAQSEAKLSDLQARIETLDQQLSSTQSFKYSAEQRNSMEVNRQFIRKMICFLFSIFDCFTIISLRYNLCSNVLVSSMQI